MTMVMMAPSTTLFLLLCVLLQEGCGLPLSAPSEQHPPPRIRTKRCSCNSWLDKECIYFCHLDIIWVNTPSKILPYGLGSVLSRRRRATDRCECADRADQSCSSFCQRSSENLSIAVVGPLIETGSLSHHTNSNKLLASLRSAVSSNTDVLSSRKTASKANRLKAGTRR